MQLSDDQNRALKNLKDWFFGGSRSSYITLGGYAGTGKTTLVSIFRDELRLKDKKLKVLFCSYTGKATRVLAQKLKDSGCVKGDDEISTIHSMMYSPRLDKKDQIIGWDKKDELEADLIIVDEASMINEFICHDLLSYKIPVIFIGDHGQLAPIEGKFNLMQSPDIILNKVHRQAEGNPIIALSLLARQTGNVPAIKYSDTALKISRSDPDYNNIMMNALEGFNGDTLVLCGFNSTRIRLNKHLRASLGYDQQEPDNGDRVICLKNNYQKKIYNGMLGTITSVSKQDENAYFVNLDMDGESSTYKGIISSKVFNMDPKEIEKELAGNKKGMDIFDFGYAMTVHKSQGSQAKRVILFEERFSKMDDETYKRWLYTAVTRASDELIIFGN